MTTEKELISYWLRPGDLGEDLTRAFINYLKPEANLFNHIINLLPYAAWPIMEFWLDGEIGSGRVVDVSVYSSTSDMDYTLKKAGWSGDRYRLYKSTVETLVGIRGEKRPFRGTSTTGVVNDPVDHPSHYTAYKNLEIIDLTEQMNFNKGNAVKYIARAGLKSSDTEIQDLEKAVWYIKREIDRIKKNENDN